MKCQTITNTTTVEAKKILILEDSRMVNNLLYMEFTKDSHIATQTFSIAEAKEALDNSTFDLAILDMHLPDGNGLEIIGLIKKDYPSTKIVIFTGHANDSERNSLFSLGILDYYVKNSTIKHSISEISNLIKNIDYNTNYNVLIIDDSITIRMHLKLILEQRSFNIFEAPNGNAGLEVLKSNNIDLVILDMELPDIHGLKVLEKIKSSNKHNVPVIVLSGKSNSEIVRDCYKLGAAEFIHKPYVPEEILIKIDQWLQRYYNRIKLDCSVQLMKEYKETIDENDIVSKTDKEGRITFVNQEFCNFSGYTEDELLGKRHNFIRHPDMDSEVFRELWQTIKAKKTWRGIIKNRKKDGSHYWVDSVIKPIVDNNGDIIEYIAMRNDITEIQDIKERLATELNITSNNFQEAYQRSKAYESALDQTTLLYRTDLNGKIIYVNQAFSDSSGYSIDELFGKTPDITRHADADISIENEIWDTVSNGKIWKGLLHNIRKDGTPYWLNASIIPIKNKDGITEEYMAIHNDVTEIINLHTEIEETQKELIYRMGELAETRSKETGNHIKRVAAYSKLIAEKHGLSSEESELLFLASPMHDIGKLSTPDSVLNKPGKLNEDEWKIMQAHAKVGYDLLSSSEKPILKASAIVAHQHHEKWNGNGYPQGLKAEEIHIFGRITAIADVFDALGSDRAYKKAWENDKIINLIKEERGKHFDPDLVDVFLDNLDEVYKIRDSYKDAFNQQ